MKANKLRELMLMALASLPVGIIAVPAEAKLLDLKGEEQTSRLREEIELARSMLFEKQEMSTTLEVVRTRVSDFTGLDEVKQIDEEIARHVQVLLENGLIEVNENKIISKSPSPWGGG